jgi:hypothetical protein
MVDAQEIRMVGGGWKLPHYVRAKPRVNCGELRRMARKSSKPSLVTEDFARGLCSLQRCAKQLCPDKRSIRGLYSSKLLTHLVAPVYHITWLHMIDPMQ